MLSAVLLLTGCSALGSPDNTQHGPLEKLNVTILNSADLPPFWLALDEGYFQAEGLDVEFDVAPTGDKAQVKVISGKTDIAFTTYPLLFLPIAKDAAKLQLVADGTSASPNSNQLMTIPGSPVQKIGDLKGRRVAITSQWATSDLLTKSALLDNGIKPEEVTFVPVPLPNMEAALEHHDVDAVYLPEPFISQASKDIGATRIYDVATGATKDFPVGGYIATTEWVQGNAKKMAAFQRALAKGVTATADRTKVNAVIVKYMKTKDGIAELMTLPRYAPPSPDPRRIQRVPDLLLQFHAITNGVDAAKVIAPQAA